MIQRLNPRERKMVIVIGVILFALANLMIFSAIRSGQAARSGALRTKLADRDTLRVILAEAEHKEAREAWLARTQPKLENRDRAAVTLLEEIQSAAKARNVLLENPQLGVIEAKPYRQTVSVSIDTRSDWEGLVSLLHALEQPELFTVIEDANLQIDPSDPTRMRGRFRIARWFAPQ